MSASSPSTLASFNAIRLVNIVKVMLLTTATCSPWTSSAFGFVTTITSKNNVPQRMMRKSVLLFNNLSSDSSVTNTPSQPNAQSLSGYKSVSVNWYPGHIAKAEKQLSETLRSVDVIIEVRDARIPKATAHPRVGEWAQGKPRVVVITRMDTVSSSSINSWKRSYDKLGAGNWDSEVDKQIKNQALQALNERQKYGEVNNEEYKLTLNKKDFTSTISTKKLVSSVEEVIFVDAKRGQGVHSIHRAILKAGMHVNERRIRRGLSDRALRVGVIGFPNVGKSALINRILGKKRAKTANTPGVTRSLNWIRVKTDSTSIGASSVHTGKSNPKRKDFELLDSPGIIPANMFDQSDALLLSACNSIGTGAYDNQAVAAYLFEWIKTLNNMGMGDLTSPQWVKKCIERYQFDPLDEILLGRPMTGEDMLFLVADNTCRGDPENAARKILQDFRNGRLGPIALQLAPSTVEDEGQTNVNVQRGIVGASGSFVEEDLLTEEKAIQEREERARKALVMAEERGLELPPMVVDSDKGPDGFEKEKIRVEEVGKGLFDGW